MMKHVFLVSLLTGGSALVAAPKASYQCIDANGKEVTTAKSKKDCTAPNKWQKASDKTSAMKSNAGAPKQN